jgi:hypothetical protein
MSSRSSDLTKPIGRCTDGQLLRCAPIDFRLRWEKCKPVNLLRPCSDVLDLARTTISANTKIRFTFSPSTMRKVRMSLPRCPYCLEDFTPSRYHPHQAVCSRNSCQRQRRANDHRQRIESDPSYRAQCRDSQQKWREQNPQYMRNYRREKHRDPVDNPSQQSIQPLRLLQELVKNSSATDVTAYPVTVWLISSDEKVKNIFANAKAILIETRNQR